MKTPWAAVAATLQEAPTPEREAVFLDQVRAGNIQHRWATIVAEDDAHSVELEVSEDALRLGTPDDSVRIAVSASTAQRIADHLDAMLLTPRIADLIRQQAGIVVAPALHAPNATMGTTSRWIPRGKRVCGRCCPRGFCALRIASTEAIDEGLACRPPPLRDQDIRADLLADAWRRALQPVSGSLPAVVLQKRQVSLGDCGEGAADGELAGRSQGAEGRVWRAMHPHDRLFRHIFSDPENAAGELRTMLSGQVSAAIDWSTLKLEPGTYVDKRLDELRSDLLFSARCGGRPVLLYLLMEHQSSDERFMALRLLGYMVKIWEDHRRAHQDAMHLPAILPLVVCHDDAGWHAPRAFAELLDIPPGMADVLAPQMLSFEMLLDDLTRAKSEELWDRAMSELGRATLFVLKRARQSPDMTAELMPYAGLLRDLAHSAHGLAALGAILRYILAVNEASPERVLELARALGPGVEQSIMTGEQVLIQRGRAEGEARGEARGKAEGVLRVLAARKLAIGDDQRGRILACTDLKRLDDWLDRAVIVETTDELFSD